MNTDHAAVDLTEAEASAQAEHESELQAQRDAAEAARAEAARIAAEEARANDPAEQARIAAEADRAAAAEARAAAEAAAAEARAAADAAQAAAQAQQGQQAQQQARDFDAELAELERQYDEGDINQAQFRERERELVREQARLEVAREAESRQQQDAEATAAQQWEAAQRQFFTDPGNAALVEGPIKLAAFEAAVKEAVNHVQAGATYADVLTKARELVTGVPAVDAEAAARSAAAQRRISEPGAQPTLRDVPNAAATGDVPGASLDHLDIDALEDRLARMSDADREAYLAGAPGGLRDNARAVD